MILQEMMRANREVYTLTEQNRIIDAVELMLQNRVGSVVIVDDDGRVCGMITDRDIAMVLAYGSASSESLVTETMSRDVQVMNQQLTLLDATRIFRDADVKRMPIVDSDNRPIGIVSIDDILALLARELFDTCGALEPKLGHMV
jgi:predicted transcriptional regulator